MNALQKFVSLKKSLEQERNQLRARLQEIESVLGTEAAPVSAPAAIRRGPGRPKGSKRKVSAVGNARRSAAAKARWAKLKAEKGQAAPKTKPSGRVQNPLSLPKAVLQVTSQRPMTKLEILEAVQKIGYRFSTKKPLQSLNPVLYKGKLNLQRKDGKFSAPKKA